MSAERPANASPGTWLRGDEHRLRFGGGTPPKTFLKREFAPAGRKTPTGWRLNNTRNEQIHRLRVARVSKRMACTSIFGAAEDLQYVYPLADPRLIEFVLGVPTHLYVRDGVRRSLMREIARGIIPERVRTNTSKGEPARVAHSIALVIEGMKLIEDPPGGLRPAPARARYIDLEAFETALADLVGGTFRYAGKLMSAIQFLRLADRFQRPRRCGESIVQTD